MLSLHTHVESPHACCVTHVEIGVRATCMLPNPLVFFVLLFHFFRGWQHASGGGEAGDVMGQSTGARVLSGDRQLATLGADW